MIKENISTLIGKGIIDPEKLEKLNFKSTYELSPDELKNAQKYIAYFLKEHFERLPQINYTVLSDTRDHSASYSLSAPLLETLRKCQKKQNASKVGEMALARVVKKRNELGE